MPGHSASLPRHLTGPAAGARLQPEPRLLHQKFCQTTPPVPLSGRAVPQFHAGNKIKQFTCRHLRRTIIRTLAQTCGVPDSKKAGVAECVYNAKKAIMGHQAEQRHPPKEGEALQSVLRSVLRSAAVEMIAAQAEL
ncbi:hypothetical protein NDU88_002591 [Pleurodeles waltl]|uniref:Uncharacterized protein n=1 Tax=Pleurodeles waltl TaxID=8319 RepID=A0AAV7NE21_PLEWA|nr:hypothetical protein NDU88_002591 [Pleurodeles waltl]